MLNFIRGSAEIKVLTKKSGRNIVCFVKHLKLMIIKQSVRELVAKREAALFYNGKQTKKHR